jgi:hypothetical protein
VIIFGSVRFLSKKITKPKFKKKTETGSNRLDSVRFGFLKQKPVQTGLAHFFPIWLGFFLFFFYLGSVRFGFFKILIVLIGFFHGLVFSVIFFPVFSVFQFFGFFVHPYYFLMLFLYTLII